MDQQINGMHLHVVQTKKFKTILLSLKFVNLLELETAYKRYTLLGLLFQSSKHYPDQTALSRASDVLYGADFDYEVSTLGNLNIMHIFIEAIHPHFVGDIAYFSKLVDLLNEILFYPDIHEDGFDQNVFDKHIENIHQFYDSYYDERVSYGVNHLCELMAPDHPLGVLAFGKQEQLSLLDPKMLLEYYQEVLKNDEKHFYLVGDISNEMIQIIQNKIHFDTIIYEYPVVNCFQSKRIKEQVIVEKQEVSQTLLYMGLTTSTVFQDNDYYAMILVNYIFGGGSSSLLFQEVREKNSLCYSISSYYDVYCGVITLHARIDGENTKKVIEQVKYCLSFIQTGNFNDQMIETAKVLIVDETKTSQDDLYHIVSNQFKKDLAHLENHYSDLTKIQQVTKEEVINASRKVKIDTIYILGDEDENEL